MFLDNSIQYDFLKTTKLTSFIIKEVIYLLVIDLVISFVTIYDKILKTFPVKLWLLTYGSPGDIIENFFNVIDTVNDVNIDE